MALFKNFFPFIKARLSLVLLLWASILAATWCSTYLYKLVDEKSHVSFLPSLFAYADYRLVILLAMGALIGGGTTSFILSKVVLTPGDAVRQIEVTAKLWDEVSSASTHLAMAYLAAMILDRSGNHEWPEFLLVVIYIGLGWLLYKGESTVTATGGAAAPASKP